MLSVRGGFPWARTASDAKGPFWALAVVGKRTNKLAATVSAMARSKKRKRSERGIDGSPFIGGHPMRWANDSPIFPERGSKRMWALQEATFGPLARILETRA